MKDASSMREHAQVVIIGAGIVGCSLADHLTRLGMREVVVLEQGPLFATGGSTSHAPGLVFQTNFSQTMTEFAKQTIKRYGELDLDGQPCLYSFGSIEVASTPERWYDLQRKAGVAASWGVEGHLITPGECVDRVPLLDRGMIYGGFYVPSDGVAKPVRAAEAMARLATARGATFHGHTAVTGIEVVDGRVQAVQTSAGRIEAEIVVSCVGIWGPRIGQMVGVSIPLLPMQHQYARTAPLPVLAGETREVTHAILRHQDRDLYFRQHGECYGVGSYQHRPMPVSASDLPSFQQDRPMPSVMSFTQADFQPAWDDARALLPLLRETTVAEGINGMFSFTSDGFPLLGESREVRGFWMAEAVWITHAVGVAAAVAEAIATGVPSVDLRACDIHRFEAHAHSPAYVLTRSSQAFREVYDIIHPLQPAENCRPLRVSPFFARQQDLEACFFEAGGWERPQWYAANAPLVTGRAIPARELWAGRYWSPIVGAEHLITRERVAMYDMTPLKRVEITGPGALDFLQHLTTSTMDRSVGSVTYTLMLDHAGGIKSDITVSRLGRARFQVGCNGPRDLDWFAQHLPADGSVHVQDITAATCCIGLWGPRARDLVQYLSQADFSETGHRFFRAREVFLREVPVLALRLSYVGELGWELYTSSEYGLRLWNLLWETGQPLGVIAAGRGAFDSLRLEKGYRSYGKDMWTEHDPFEAGLGFVVNLDKPTFIGKEALAQRKAAGPRRRLTCLTLDDASRVVMGSEPVYSGHTPVGFVTSAAYGYSIGRGIAYAWLPPDLATGHTPLQIDYFGERLAATVTAEPLFDPTMARMRSLPKASPAG